MRIQVKGTPSLDEYLSLEQVRPLKPGVLIKAMDDFARTGEEPGTRYQLAYGLLSAFAHPAMGGTRYFFDAVEENENGWFISYRSEDL